MEKIKRVAVNLGLMVLSLALILLAIEIALRFTPYASMIAKDKKLRYYYRNDAVKGYDISPNVKKMRTSTDNNAFEYDIWSNELACFDKPYHGEQHYVLLVGDSFTHQFAPFEDMWGTQIENLLGRRVLKCGVSGYGTNQEYHKAQEVMAQTGNNPGLIIVGYCLNDLDSDIWGNNLTVHQGFLVGRSKDLEQRFARWQRFNLPDYPLSFFEMIQYTLDRHSILVNMVNRIHSFSEKHSYLSPLEWTTFADPEAKQNQWRRHLENLKMFKKLAAQHHANLLIVLIPLNIQVYPGLIDWGAIDPERPNQVLRRFLTQEGIPYIDLLPLFRTYADQKSRKFLDSGKDLYWRANSHFNIRGNHLAGLLVSRYMLENNLIEVQDKPRRLAIINHKLKSFETGQ
jgi:GDSL-like Lipase/Acylhydrolase family